MISPQPSTRQPGDTLPGILANGHGATTGPQTAPPISEETSSESTLELQLRGIDNRERALPVRQSDLTRLLLAEPGLTSEDRTHLTAFGRTLGAMFHSEFYERLRELKELYAPLDPDSDYIDIPGQTQTLTEHSDEDFLIPFEAALERANYRPIDRHILEEAISAPNEMGLTYVPDFSLFEHLKVYVRGYTRIVRDCRSVRTKFLKRTVHIDTYQRMVVALKFKPGEKLGPYVRSDVLYLRMFKDVPHVDMEMYLPEQGTKVRMRWIDKAQIASPFAIGIPTLAVRILLGLTAPFALGALMVPITAGLNSFFGFRRAKHRHLSAMIQKLYYMTLANNASVLTRLIDSAEDEEYKEALLAYFFLWRGPVDGQPWDVPRLDAHIENYLKEKTGIEINFEVADALGKLFRLGLARRDSRGQLHATPIEATLRALDGHWDKTFHYV
jgi:hypothetical protein